MAKIDVHKLKTALKDSGMSASSFAKAINIHPHDIYNGYKGEGINDEKLKLIAKKLNRPISHFLQNDKPYDPELYRKILDLANILIAQKKLQISATKVKELHSSAYNIAIKLDNPSDEFLSGIILSTIEYSL
jgi:predicted transcriptional regulator